MLDDSLLKQKWDPYFYNKFLGFENSLPLWRKVDYFDHWPIIKDYNQFATNVTLPNGSAIRFVVQNARMQYENEIYQHHVVPTRLFHWHDFFNNLTWMTFPKTKWAMIQKSYQEKATRLNKNRTATQNVLAHFDECGVVLCSDKDEFFDYFQNFEWKKCFWNLREELLNHCYPIIVGHGILEKALMPYIGLTAKIIFLKTTKSFFSLSTEEKMTYVDSQLSHYIMSPDFPASPKALTPFPLLGWPTWHPDNSLEAFYDNMNYFRKKPLNPCGVIALIQSSHDWDRCGDLF